MEKKHPNPALQAFDPPSNSAYTKYSTKKQTRKEKEAGTVKRLMLVVLGIVLFSLPIRGQELVTREDSAKIWFSVGKDYFNKGQIERAIKNFHRALSYDSTLISVYLHLGQAYLKLNQLDSAEIAYRKVAEIDPTDSRGWQGLGFMYGIVKKDLEKGIEFYKKAIEVDPSNKDAWFGLATLLDKAGRGDEADSIYLVAIQQDPDNLALVKAYGLFLASRKDYKKALPYLEKVYGAGNHDPKVEDRLLDAYLALGKDSTAYLEKALTILDKKLETDSLNITLHLKRADVLAKLGRVEESLQDYDMAARLRPDSPVPLLKKASILVEKLRDYSGARIALKKALELKMEDRVRAAALALLGDTYFQPAQKLRKEADALRKKGIEREARKTYARAVELYDEAIKIYKQAMQYQGSQWADYAAKQAQRAEKLRQKAWRRSQGID